MNAKTPRQRADEFLKISDQFRLGDLTTEQSHPVTANLSEAAKTDTAAALDLLFQVDGDVVAKFREWVNSGRSQEISEVVTNALLNGGRVFFTGCGATGRLSILLDSIWRDFWQRSTPSPLAGEGRGEGTATFENRTISIMAGGDFALIKSVEGFEDITAFGRRQIAEHNPGPNDVVFAITEGGETSWVIGTAWEALDRGAKVYFVYNNPDDVLCKHVQRSREVIEDPRIEKVNLTTGPMAITGSTRMQATSIQLCVMLTIMEMALLSVLNRENPKTRKSETVPGLFLADLQSVYSELRSQPVLDQLAGLVELEESVYRHGGKTNYFADSLAVDVLTDTTERSPTFCVPPFRKLGDEAASESWAFLFLPKDDTREAWEYLLKREPRAVEWSLAEVAELIGEEDAHRRHEVIRKISIEEIIRFTIGLEGLRHRPLRPRDAAIAIEAAGDSNVLEHLEAARSTGARTGVVRFGTLGKTSADSFVNVHLPESPSLLGFTTHVAAKLLLNALSTCIMVRLGRVMGNYMIYVVPSNLKLIDRATRYITRLTDLTYEAACRLLFEVIEYVEPRMEANQAYPPVVGMAVTRAKCSLSNEEAEDRILRIQA